MLVACRFNGIVIISMLGIDIVSCSSFDRVPFVCVLFLFNVFHVVQNFSHTSSQTNWYINTHDCKIGKTHRYIENVKKEIKEIKWHSAYEKGVEQMNGEKEK